MSQKNIIPEHDIKAIAARVQKETGYLPEPSRPPAEKQMGVEVAALDPETLERKPEEAPAADAPKLPPHERKIVREEKPLEKTLVLPTDFDAQVEQIFEAIEEIHSMDIVKEVYIKADFNFEDAVNKLLILRTKELEEEISEDAEKWKKVELTEKEKKEVDSILEEVGNDAITKERATKAYVECGKKYEETVDYLAAL